MTINNELTEQNEILESISIDKNLKKLNKINYLVK